MQVCVCIKCAVGRMKSVTQSKMNKVVWCNNVTDIQKTGKKTIMLCDEDG